MENNEPVEISQDEIDSRWSEAKASMTGHSWLQQGTEVICDSCPFRHGFYVEAGTILTGIDEDGNPILDKIGY